AERSSRWWFAISITIFCLIACFCFAIVIFAMVISDQKETTLLGEDLDLGGGNEDKQTTTTTQKAYHNRHEDINPERATRVDTDIHENPDNARTDHYYPCDYDDTGNYEHLHDPINPGDHQYLQDYHNLGDHKYTEDHHNYCKADKAPRGTVVCTVSNQVRPEKSAYPVDGVCDLLFFDSFYKDNKNVLANSIGKFEANARSFLYHASLARATESGISLAFTNTTSKADFLTEKFYEGAIGVLYFNVTHYGFLNLYGEFSTPTAVRDALLVLKALYFRLKYVNNNRSFYVLGLSIDFAEEYTTVDVMRTVFVPSMFIAIGHISYSDASFPDCRILPPSIRRFPINLSSRFNRSYGHTLNDTLPILDLVRKSHPNLPLFISVGLSGRNYAPKLVEDVRKRYVPFQDCKNFLGPYFEDPANVCPSVAGADWEIKDSTFYGYRSLVNQKLKRTFTFDTERTLKAKVCEIKGNLLNVSFGVAAYDVDYDSNPRGCHEVEIEPGAFNRLSAIRPLSNFVLNKYTNYSDCLIA
ncbi:hypothetical protein MTO96_031017, partial [Rhipicephalus appendiculatus]